MREDITSRVLEGAEFILANGATVRACADALKVSKTTVHKDMRARLPLIDEKLAGRVDEILNLNLAERHLRGGRATKEKYLHQTSE